MDLFVTMKVFRRVVEQRSFSGAARDLRLSNAAVSKHIAQLEEHLRAKLLERTTRRVAVTKAGATYYEHCAQILDQLDLASQAIGREHESVRGTLRVNAPVGFGLLHFVPRITDFLHRMPELKIELSLNDRFIDLVEEGVDVAIRISTDLPDSSSLVAHRLARVRTAVVGSPSYFRKHGTPKTLQDLSRLNCVCYSLGQARSEWTFEGPRGRVRLPVQGNFEVNNSLAICSVLEAGLGISQLPLFYVDEALRSKRLREVLVDRQPQNVSIFAVHPRARHTSMRLRLFVEFLREWLLTLPWASPPTNAKR